MNSLGLGSDRKPAGAFGTQLSLTSSGGVGGLSPLPGGAGAQGEAGDLRMRSHFQQVWKCANCIPQYVEGWLVNRKIMLVR